MFHHFHGRKFFKSQGSISSKQFDSILLYLKKNYNLLDAHEYLKKIENNEIKKKDVCLTFDDCLKSQYEIAYPVMRKHNITGFFFIYSGAFDRRNNFEIYREFRNTMYKKIDDFYDDFFSTLENIMPKKFLEFNLKFNKKYLSNYKFYSLNDRKFRFCRDQILSEKNYEKVMSKIMIAKKFNIIKNKKKLFMRLNDLKTLNQRKNIIGLHSDSHPVNIFKLSYVQQLKDYKKNYNFLKKNLGIIPTTMSHPFGRYNINTLRVLKKFGIKLGFLSRKMKYKSTLEIGRIDHTYFLKKKYIGN